MEQEEEFASLRGWCDFSVEAGSGGDRTMKDRTLVEDVRGSFRSLAERTERRRNKVEGVEFEVEGSVARDE